MNKKVKIIAIVVGIIIVLIAGVFLYFKSTYIGKDKVREIVINKMNVKEYSLRFGSIDLEKDEDVYDVDVYYNNQEYEFKIGARDGKIVYTNYGVINNTNKQNVQNNSNNQNSQNSSNNQSSQSNIENNNNGTVVDEGISIDEAKALVLQDNNLTENDVVFTKLEKDHDNNNLIYDIEFVYNNMEYSYEVRAIDGQIISFEQDDAH